MHEFSNLSQWIQVGVFQVASNPICLMKFTRIKSHTCWVDAAPSTWHHPIWFHVLTGYYLQASIGSAFLRSSHMSHKFVHFNTISFYRSSTINAEHRTHEFNWTTGDTTREREKNWETMKEREREAETTHILQHRNKGENHWLWTNTKSRQS